MKEEQNALKVKLGVWYDRFKKYGCFLAGGAITSLFTNSEVNDYDIYFRNKELLSKFLEYEIRDRNWVKVVTDKAFSIESDGNKFQFIFFDYFDSAEDIFETFDFTVCMGAYDFKEEKFILGDNFLIDNAKRRIKFNPKTKFPIVSLMRLDKYKKKGYKTSKAEKLRIIFTIMQLKIETKEQLSSQIGGMYGERYDNILKDFDEGNISLPDVVEKISEFEETEDSFKLKHKPNFFSEDWDELWHKILGTKIKCFKYGGKIFKKNSYGDLEILCDEEDFEEEHDTSLYEITDSENLFNFPLKRYKYVRKLPDGRMVSFFNNSFEYKIGQFACDTSNGVYAADKDSLNLTTYANKEDKVCIEVLVLGIEDCFLGNRMSIDFTGVQQKFKKVLPVRVVPQKEINNEDNDEMEDFF